MIDFSAVGDASSMGRLLRYPLRALPKSTVMPVLQGPLRGARWVSGSSNHGCWLGSYEREKQVELARALTPGSVFFDIGANVGFYTLLGSKLVGPTGRVHAFEPLPNNLAALRRHMALNACSNVFVHDVAVSDRNGEARFSIADSNAMGHLAESGELAVRTVALDDFALNDGQRTPTCLKIDVEGAEGQVLRGAARLLRTARPLVFLATHGRAAHEESIALLRDAAYEISGIAGRPVADTDELIARPATRQD